MNARRRYGPTGLLASAASLLLAGATQVGPHLPASAPATLSRIPQAKGAIGGVVVDAGTGQPVAGALISLRHREAVDSQAADPKGRFLFTDLPDYDGYSLTATKAGYLPARYPTATTVAGGRAAAVVVAGGQAVLGLNVTLRPAASLSGVVRDDRGEPVVGGHVRVLTERRVAGRRRLAFGPIVETDDRGAFRLSGLSPGRYHVQLTSPVYTVANASSSSPVNAVNMTTGRGRGSSAGAQGAIFADLDGLMGLLMGGGALPPADSEGRLRVYPVTYHPAATQLTLASPRMLAPGEQLEGVDLRVTPARPLSPAP